MSTAPGLRREIQALRALAVLAVVIYHIWPTILPGGFIGVDVFFVISGYLITSHLLREVDRTGTVRLTVFWGRRVRRLLPAAFVVLIASAAATLLVLPWTQWQQGLKEIAASALYVENWLLAVDSVDYLAAENVPSLVQHFWSLSVEEQFYLVWPLLILMVIWLTGRTRSTELDPPRRGALNRRNIGFALLGIVVLGAVCSVVWTQVSAPSAYFSTATRAWEFAAGGLMSFAPALAKVARRWTLQAHLVASWGGLAVIGVGLVAIDGSTPFPGVAAALPVIGTVLVIWAGEDESVWSPTFVGRFGGIQFIGDVSYSVYLWHWPIVVLYPVLRGNAPEVKGGLLILAASLLLGWLSKRFVEDPFRASSWWIPRLRTFSFAGSGMVVICAIATVSVLVLNSNLSAAREPRAPYASVAELQADIAQTLTLARWPLPDQAPGRSAQAHEWIVDNCIDVTSAEARETCVYGNPDSDRVIAVVGDSYATALLPAIRAAFGDDYRIQPLTMGQCPLIDVIVYKSGSFANFDSCVAHNAATNDLLTQLKPDMVILADATISTIDRMKEAQDRPARAAIYVDRLDRSFATIQALGLDNVVLIETAPFANCFPEQAFSSPQDCHSDSATALLHDVQQKKLASASAHGIATVDTTDWMCTDALICPDQIGNILVRADHAHMTNTFSGLLGPVLRTAVDNALR